MDPYATSLLVYNMTLLPIIFISTLYIVLVVVSYAANWRKKETFPDVGTPFVTVQVPTYNDPVGARCVEHCLKFDYPHDRYEIMIVDDSTKKENQELMRSYATRYPDRVSYVHRDNREGFKPGALQAAMHLVRGEIIVLFDADWMPRPDFLKTVLGPFADEKVAIVQTRQGFYNMHTNLITRFASYLLMIYHTLVMPINNKINCVFFCGTAGALRKSAMQKVGGWNSKSVTEDSDLSVRLFGAGYRSVYIDYETPSEVPETFEAFLKQQLRWGYGNARVFFDHWKTIIFGKGFTMKQRGMISFITLSNGSAFIVIAMTLAGMSGWFLGEPRLMNLTDLQKMGWNFLVTGGFLFSGMITFIHRKQAKEIPYFILAAMSMGLLMAGTMCVAFTKAILNRPLWWICTPKVANEKVGNES